MPAKRFDPKPLAARIRAYLAANPDITSVTVPYLHRMLGGAKRHEWERALHLLNLSGEMHKAIRGGTHCCGDCRADRYLIRRKDWE